MVQMKSDLDWTEIADQVCEILQLAYVRSGPRLAAQAKVRGVSLESLVAAAIYGMLEQELGPMLLNRKCNYPGGNHHAP
jgi:hypothetical protein